MKDRATLELENKLLQTAAKGQSVLTSGFEGKSILVTPGREDVPVAVEMLDISPKTLRAVIEGLRIPSISFYDLPRPSFAVWIRKLRASGNEDIAQFGNGLHRSYRHFRNHDLEGNRYNRAGEIIDNDGVSLA